jgi:streptogramin lyase
MGTPESPRRHHRQLGYFDTETQETVLIDTCYGTHHLQFDADGYLWTSGDSYVFGRFNPNTFDPDDPSTLGPSQDWWEVVVDSDGDGAADTPIVGFNYGVMPNIFDGTVWSAIPGYPGRIIRFDPATEEFETYIPPAPGNGGRGIDVDTNGDVWVCLSGSSQVAKFERDLGPR